jgi:hypothetical protein
MPTYDEDLTNLDECLRRLTVEYHIFFSGNRKNPPDDLRQRTERTIKKLSECKDLSYSQRFRYNTLLARFYVYKDRWRRKLHDREMGTERKKEAADTESASAPQNTVRSQEAIHISISDPKAEGEKVRALYDALIHIRGINGNKASPSFQQFAKYIEAQTLGIREKHKCSKVAFTIALEDDAIRFTAAAEKR